VAAWGREDTEGEETAREAVADRTREGSEAAAARAEDSKREAKAKRG